MKIRKTTGLLFLQIMTIMYVQMRYALKMYIKRRLNISLIITCTLQMSMMRRNKTPNLGRVRPKSYAKSDARKPKSTKKQPPELESSETVSLPATDSHSSIQFNTDSEKHEDCPSNPQLPIRKEFYEIVTELMENSVVTEICEGDYFSFENFIPDNKIHVIEDNNEDPLMGQDEENQASDSGEIFPKDTPIYPGHFMSVHHSMTEESVSPHTPWGQINTELWLLFVSNDMSQLNSDQPQNPYTPPIKYQHRPNTLSNNYHCNLYNSGEQCRFYPNCRFKHSCKYCDGTHAPINCD
uniref:C3H1-type domain-containing protein n=1 Tax=Magallana gigas TaxID=29159 RepID=A0A8W8P032_MAGGI